VQSWHTMDRAGGHCEHPRWVAVARGVMLVIVSASALAGQADSTRGLRTIRNLSETTRYRIHTRTPSILFGRIAGVSRESLTLTSETAAQRSTSVALRDITAVWFRHGTEGGKGFVLGTGIGVGLGLLIGTGEGGDLGSGRVILATLLGCVGAVTGIVVGMNTDHYRRIPWP
jgi:hypothetical protein